MRVPFGEFIVWCGWRMQQNVESNTCDRGDVLGTLDVPHHLGLLVLVPKTRVELGHQLVGRIRLMDAPRMHPVERKGGYASKCYWYDIYLESTACATSDKLFTTHTRRDSAAQETAQQPRTTRGMGTLGANAAELNIIPNHAPTEYRIYLFFG